MKPTLKKTSTAWLAPIAELCAHYRVPLLVHTNDPVGAVYPGKAALSLPALYNAIKAFPNVDWILAHWGGGLPFYGLMKKEGPEVLSRVYFDTAASPYLYRPQIYRLAAEMVGPEKIIFGSDYPLLPVSRYLKEMEDAGLPEDWREMIWGGIWRGCWGGSVSFSGQPKASSPRSQVVLGNEKVAKLSLAGKCVPKCNLGNEG